MERLVDVSFDVMGNEAPLQYYALRPNRIECFLKIWQLPPRYQDEELIYLLFGHHFEEVKQLLLLKTFIESIKNSVHLRKCGKHPG